MDTLALSTHVFAAGEDGITCAFCPLPKPNRVHTQAVDITTMLLDVVRDVTLSPYARLAYVLYLAGVRGTDREIGRQIGVVTAVAVACHRELTDAGYLA